MIHLPSLQIARDHGGEIQLLLTDVVMPGMNGVDLASAVSDICPGVRVLFESGYPDGPITRRGALEDGRALILKPFSGGELAIKVREVLDRAGPKP